MLLNCSIKQSLESATGQTSHFFIIKHVIQHGPKLQWNVKVTLIY